MAKVSSTISIHPFIFQRCESLKAEEDTHIQHSLQKFAVILLQGLQCYCNIAGFVLYGKVLYKEGE